MLPGREDKTRQEIRLFLSCFQMEGRVRAGGVQERAKGAKDENKKRKRTMVEQSVR